MRRIQLDAIRNDLTKKMVLLSGPRQVGKSWLAKSLMTSFSAPLYLNYDNRDDRTIIENASWRVQTDFLVLDELHKMPGWKGYLKGLFDTKPAGLSILVTGSARLETFRQSGDSLAGRYFHHRLLPFTPAETTAAGKVFDLDRFLERGGFPEPLLAKTADDAGRWRRQYLDGLIREDILTFENVHELKALNLLVRLLRNRVGSPISYQNLAGDLGVAPNTVKRYIGILEALYIVFLVTPYSRTIARSINRQPKLYFFDTALVDGEAGARLENLVALSLLKHVYLREERDGVQRALCYLKTKEGKDVDFVFVENEQPTLMVEVKTATREISPSLRYFSDRYGIPGVQLSAELRHETDSGALVMRRALDWLSGLV